MIDDTTDAEAARLWNKNHRPDGTLIPLSELYPDIYPSTPECPPRGGYRPLSTNNGVNAELILWLETRLGEAKAGTINAVAISAVPCGDKHRNCATFHFFHA